jgi:transposase
MEAFSTRERRKIISLYQQGLDTEEIAQQFGASLAGVRRVWQQYREEGRDSPAYANCGRKPTLDEAEREQLLEIARRRPDAFCHELADEVQKAMGVRVTRQTIGRWLRELGITRKKSRSMPASRSVRTSKSSVTIGCRG